MTWTLQEMEAALRETQEELARIKRLRAMLEFSVKRNERRATRERALYESSRG